MLTSLYVFGKLGDTALFHNLCWKLSKQLCSKVCFISERKKSKVICLYSFVKVFWEEAHSTEEEKYWICNFECSSRYLSITYKRIYRTFMLPIDRSLPPSAIQTWLKVHYRENLLAGLMRMSFVTLKLKVWPF